MRLVCTKYIPTEPWEIFHWGDNASGRAREFPDEDSIGCKHLNLEQCRRWCHSLVHCKLQLNHHRYNIGKAIQSRAHFSGTCMNKWCVPLTIFAEALPCASSSSSSFSWWWRWWDDDGDDDDAVAGTGIISICPNTSRISSPRFPGTASVMQFDVFNPFRRRFIEGPPVVSLFLLRARFGARFRFLSTLLTAVRELLLLSSTVLFAVAVSCTVAWEGDGGCWEDEDTAGGR